MAIVIDNGSGSIKTGFAGDDAPRSVFSSVIGYPRNPATASKSSFVGSEVDALRDKLSLKFPNEFGVVTHWDHMSKILEHAVEIELRVAGSDHPILLTEPPLNPKGHREKALQVLFENLHTPAAYLAPEQTLALYAAGRTTGLTIDVGYGVTYLVPIFNGIIVPDAVTRFRIGGREISGYLNQLLSARGIKLATNNPEPILQQITEKLLFVKTGGEEDKKGEDGFQLPDGQTISVGDERYRAPELLFQPALYGAGDNSTLTENTLGAVNRCDLDIRKQLFSSIVLTGGSSLLPGLGTRLGKEVRSKLPESTRVNVVSPAERKYAAWIGGSVLASLPTFQNIWITKKEYEENGASIVHRRCAF